MSNFELKRQQLIELRQLEDSGYIDLYFADESHFSLMPYIPYAWQRNGTQIRLPSSRSKAINVIGAISRKGKLFYEVHNPTINSDLMISFIDQFCNQIEKRTVIVLDNAPIHRSKKFKKQMEEWQERDLYIFFITPYSPELNVIEILEAHEVLLVRVQCV